jgi:hypothetical protein
MHVQRKTLASRHAIDRCSHLARVLLVPLILVASLTSNCPTRYFDPTDTDSKAQRMTLSQLQRPKRQCFQSCNGLRLLENVQVVPECENADVVGGIQSRCRCCERWYCHCKTTQQIAAVRLSATCKNKTTRQRTFNEVIGVLPERIFEVLTGGAGLTSSAG